ncbi:MAG TPA: beta-glucosidase BglX [Verrucomicrobiae bacterium]|nr:beta-glucosidase BglX [Verrucomicrobiae bacterium]
MRILLLMIFFASLFASGAPQPVIYRDGWNDLNKNGHKDVYEDPGQPIPARVADLLARTTLDEKIGQLYQAHRERDAEKQFGDQLRQGKISSFLDGSELIETPGPRNRIQRIAVEQSRLGIPLIFGHDSIHGFRTIFPIPLAMASAWEPELFERAQQISARETAAVGINWTFGPMVDLARDPRWGRIAEGFGEDPWLGCLYAAACVRGFQGTNPADPDRLVACLKHYVGYGAAEGGRDYNTTEISEYTLRNFYLPQFKAGVEAGAWTLMSAFNCLNGTPATANRHVLTEILRDQWKFPGYVVSDWTAVEELIAHGVAANGAEAGRLAITAGVDMEMVSSNYTITLKEQVKRGLIPESVIDEAARRVLTVKFVKGLFEKPYVDETLYLGAFMKPDALALAREAVAKSCVLLKNENHALPLSREVKSIALIGPFADATGDLLGCWAARGRASDVVSLATGLRAKLRTGAELKVVRGCEAIEGERTIHLLSGAQIAEHTRSINAGQTNISQAVEAAKAADVVILALGEPGSWTGEDSSRSTLDVPGSQMELFDAVAALGKPVIVVLINGRPLTINAIHDKAAAILEAWDPGVEGGDGIADILFGDVDPAGRLTVSFPRSVGQVPVYYNHYNTGRPTMGKYIDGSRDPLYPFGFGLSYTEFEYGKVELGSKSMKPGGTQTARAKIKNVGSRPGAEVVQLYIRDVAASAGPRPVRELKGFQKVFLKPGESRDVTFAISNRELGYYNRQGDWLVDPGMFQVWISKDAVSGEPMDFELTSR